MTEAFTLVTLVPGAFIAGLALGSAFTNSAWINAARVGCRRYVRRRFYFVFDEADPGQRNHVYAMLENDKRVQRE